MMIKMNKNEKIKNKNMISSPWLAEMNIKIDFRTMITMFC